MFQQQRFGLLLVVFSLLCCASTVMALEGDYWVNRTDHCMSSGLKPKEPAGLNFCTWYSGNSCCLPGADEEIMEKFLMHMELGVGCSPSSHKVKATYREIRDMMCLPCDPHEPRFRFQTKQGDVAQGGKIANDSSAADDSYTWRICKSFLYGKDGKSGMWGDKGEKYDRCGFQHLDQCSDHPQYGYDAAKGEWIKSEFPAQTQAGHYCDGDLIVPSIEFEGENPAERLIQILWMIMPVDFNFVVVDDINDPNFDYDKTPCFRGSGAAGVLSMTSLLLMGLLYTLCLLW